MLDRKRLALLCEMLRSDNDHERSVAARMATNLVRGANTTWSAVILGPAAPQARPSSPGTAYDPQAFRRGPPRTPERNGVKAATLIPALLKKRSLTHWERMRVLDFTTEDLAVGLTDVQWKEVIRLAMEFGLWPGSKAKRRVKRNGRW